MVFTHCSVAFGSIETLITFYILYNSVASGFRPTTASVFHRFTMGGTRTTRWCLRLRSMVGSIRDTPPPAVIIQGNYL